MVSSDTQNNIFNDINNRGLGDQKLSLLVMTPNTMIDSDKTNAIAGISLHLCLTTPVLDGVAGSKQFVQLVCAVTGQVFYVYTVLIKLFGVRDITLFDVRYQIMPEAMRLQYRGCMSHCAQVAELLGRTR